MRHRVSEQLVVHVARRKDLLDHPGGGVNVLPVRRGFVAAQAGKVGDVAVPKDNDRVAARDDVPFKMRVADASHKKRFAEVRPVAAEPAARTLFARLPVIGPGSCHVVVHRRLVSHDNLIGAGAEDRTTMADPAEK